MNEPPDLPADPSVPTNYDLPPQALSDLRLAEVPPQIGRYRVEKVLGEGGFGCVYQAYDTELERRVAVKVPHPDRLAQADAVTDYLTEARILARLDHPHIVPVYDVGRTEDGLCYVVSKLIEGSDLAQRLRQAPPSENEAVALVATAAEALHDAHGQGLVHRDIKPGNLLLDTADHLYVADFGLALKEEDFGKGEGFAGTPSYMSPEQARGEGHRVDGRTDIFSLGVVFYELLTGWRPFRADKQAELLHLIATAEPRPPRQVNDAIARELERICLKCLAKRASERYATARDLADDLRHFLERVPATAKSVTPAGMAEAVPSTPSPATTPTPPPAVKIIPKGLRSFDAHDAEFFLELLPGPRDREGLPDSLRFWKSRIEETDPDQTFAVGLLYGPSGCGKSSLVKAGLLPRLAKSVQAVYVEATADETEARLLRGLRKACPDLPADRDLTQTLAALRRGHGLPTGGKVLLVLDQFEQWLHARRADEDPVLVQALRQCDGGRVQALVMVRDDFWMAATRFLQALEVRLIEGENAAAVDLFGLAHARKVLAGFGRAFGQLPDQVAESSREQQQFLDQAVAGLGQEGKVICVRLALFAEMVKSKPWTPSTLKAVGGTEGVGVTFLEETFSAATAPPAHRLHQQAARAVLKALLPEQGTEIKGHLRSRHELLEASGYGRRPGDFDDLLRILDRETRLVTPTDDPASVGASARRVPSGDGAEHAEHVGLTPRRSPEAEPERYYQLTHDYLVPALRQWLTRKQKETRRGRAELRLAERAALWIAKPENRHLPAWWEWANIHLFTRPRDWTASQRRMMRAAGRYHAVRGAALALGLCLLTFTGLAIWGRLRDQRDADHAAGLVRQLLQADTIQVPDLVQELAPYRTWADPRLREALEQAPLDSRARLHASLALLPVDPEQAEYLYQRLLGAGPTELPVLQEALRGHRDVLVGRLWQVAMHPQADADERFRAACTLAGYDAAGGEETDQRWQTLAPFVVDRLLAAVQKNPSHYPPLLETLRPVGQPLSTALAVVFRAAQRSESERSLATALLADYAGDRPDFLAGLLMDADPKQFAALYPRWQESADQGLAPLYAELDRQPQPPPWPDPPADPAWTEPAPAVVRQIEAGQGILAPHSAFCQTLPLAEFLKVAEALRPSGYRPVRFRPYPAPARDGQPAVLVAAVWARDGRSWQLVHGATVDVIRRQDAEQQQAGYRAVDVAGYLDGDQQRYGALWVQEAPAAEVRLYVGVPENDHGRAGWQPLRTAGLQPQTLQSFGGADGQARFSSVWRKDAPAGTSFWADDEATHTDRGLSQGLRLDVCLTPSTRYVQEAQQELLAWLAGPPWPALYLRGQHRLVPHPERHYAGTFQGSAQLEHVLVAGLMPTQQRERGRELLRQGYRPAAVTVMATDKRGRLSHEAVAAMVWHRPVVSEDTKERLAKRQANAAVALLRMGRPEKVWPLLQHRPEPRVRSYLIHRLSPLGADPRAIVQRLGEEPDVSIRRALLLILGEFGADQLAPGERELLVGKVVQWYREDPDPGLHGAAAWCLRQWQQGDRLKEIDQEWVQNRAKRVDRVAQIRQALVNDPGNARPQWYVNGQGQTMVVIPGPVEFWMGSPATEAGREGAAEGRVEMQHTKRIGRTYAIAAHEVTVDQFRRWRADHDYNKQYARTPDCPVNLVTWYQAAAYCNWLSAQEGIDPDQWCYLPNNAGELSEGMKLRPNYLELTGYRLPSEAEWEYACRAGAVTSRSYGETEDLLGQYAWYTKNSQDRWLLPVGSLKPNDLGLFDMLGNAVEWCQDSVAYYVPGSAGRASEDIADKRDINDKLSRLLRGGAFVHQAVNVRSAQRNRNAPVTRANNVGFRPARTFR